MKVQFQQEFITRHRDLISGDALTKKIIIVGAGAIGSFVTLSLAKMGFTNLHVYDFDTVEPENIGAQFFPVPEIGNKKVAALRNMVELFTGITIHAYDAKVTPETTIDGDIVIAAVDNMEVRKMLFEIAACYTFIDPRMGAEYATMSVVDMKDRGQRENYKKTLFTDGEAVQERCTAKTTIYTVLLIAGQVVKAVKDTLTEKTPIQNMDWNIRENAMLAFSGGRRL